MPPKNHPSQNNWHIDRKLTVTALFAIVIHFGAAIWWVSAQASTNAYQDERIRELTVKQDKGDALMQQTVNIVARLDEKFNGVTGSIKDLSEEIIKMRDKMPGTRR